MDQLNTTITMVSIEANILILRGLTNLASEKNLAIGPGLT
jgi:hypothetical protein